MAIESEQDRRTGRKASATRERILTSAEQIILKRGYSGTSIDEILEAAHITKGGFFYHFRGKNDLAMGLLERYQLNDREFFTGLFDRAKDLVEDPLQQMLLFLKLLSEAMGDLPSTHPGCLVATFTYESEQVHDDVRKLNKAVIVEWRDMFMAQLRLIDQQYDKRLEVDTADLADALTATIEGGIVVSKALDEQQILVTQILGYRDHLRLLYAPRSVAAETAESD